MKTKMMKYRQKYLIKCRKWYQHQDITRMAESLALVS